MSKVIELKTRRKSNGYIVRVIVCNDKDVNLVHRMFKILKKHYYFKRSSEDYDGFTMMNFTGMIEESINIVYVDNRYDPENTEGFNTEILKNLLENEVRDMFKSKIDHDECMIPWSILYMEHIDRLTNRDLRNLSSIESYNVRFIDLYDLIEEF